jgi:hypothetical protein
LGVLVLLVGAKKVFKSIIKNKNFGSVHSARVKTRFKTLIAKSVAMSPNSW